jgi:hypothetical protein
MKRVAVDLALIRFPTTVEGLSQLCCLGCGVPMDLHHPDAGFPERMLGTCDACRCWYLMDLVPGRPEAVMVLLPDGDHFLRALEA